MKEIDVAVFETYFSEDDTLGVGKSSEPELRAVVLRKDSLSSSSLVSAVAIRNFARLT
jgi:hypothetical protein